MITADLRMERSPCTVAVVVPFDNPNTFACCCQHAPIGPKRTDGGRIQWPVCAYLSRLGLDAPNGCAYDNSLDLFVGPNSGAAKTI
jgi:hypothetical protein